MTPGVEAPPVPRTTVRSRKASPLAGAAFLAAVLLAPAALAQQAPPDDPLASARPHHVAIAVPNFDESVRWYTQKLGFRPLNARDYPSLGARGIFLERNGFMVELFARQGSRRAVPPPAAVPDDLLTEGYKHVGFSVDDVDAAVSELRRRGVVIAGEPADVGELGLRLAFIRDNNGNLIELGQPLAPAAARR